MLPIPLRTLGRGRCIDRSSVRADSGTQLREHLHSCVHGTKGSVDNSDGSRPLWFIHALNSKGYNLMRPPVSHSCLGKSNALWDCI